MSGIINSGATVTMLLTGKQDLTMGCRVSPKVYILHTLHISEIVPEMNKKRIPKEEKIKTTHLLRHF